METNGKARGELFKKGGKGGPGRPVGSVSKEKKNYLDVMAFAQLIWDGAEEAGLSGKEKIELGFRALNVLLPKIANLPGNPAHSVENTEEAAKVLKEALKIQDVKQEEVNAVNP